MYNSRTTSRISCALIALFDTKLSNPKSDNNSSGTIFYNKWKNAYLDFNYILKKSIENTKNAINAAAYSANSNNLFNRNEIVLNANNKNKTVVQ